MCGLRTFFHSYFTFVSLKEHTVLFLCLACNKVVVEPQDLESFEAADAVGQLGEPVGG